MLLELSPSPARRQEEARQGRSCTARRPGDRLDGTGAPDRALSRISAAWQAVDPGGDRDCGTRPTKTALFDAGYSAKCVTLSLALRSSGNAGRSFGRG